jgi:MFS family permease
MLVNASAKKLRIITYVAVFFLTLTASLTSYINSSYLATLVPENKVGLIYSLGSITTIILTLLIPKILCRLGIKLSTVIISSLSIGGLLLIVWQSPLVLFSILGFISYYALTQVARYNTDLYLETISDNKDTGGIRGVFMTIINLAWLASPIIASTILGPTERFYLLYFISAILMVPFMIIIGKVLPERTVCDPTSTIQDLLARLGKLNTAKDRALRKILTTDFLLNFFYAVMVIYLPLLLHEQIGFSWTEIVLFSPSC